MPKVAKKREADNKRLLLALWRVTEWAVEAKPNAYRFSAVREACTVLAQWAGSGDWRNWRQAKQHLVDTLDEDE